MKKVILSSLVSIFISIAITSCGSSIESDAKKVAELKCKAEKSMSGVLTGDLSLISESKKLAEEAKTVSEEMEGKYKSHEDAEKFAKALADAMGDCK